MNDRLNELATQAGFNLDNLPDDVLLPLHSFAELTVKECMNVLDPGGHQLIARFHTRQWLSEHFGVK